MADSEGVPGEMWKTDRHFANVQPPLRNSAIRVSRSSKPEKNIMKSSNVKTFSYAVVWIKEVSSHQ